MTFQRIARFMNSLSPAGQPRGFGRAMTLRELHAQHRWTGTAATVSLRAIANRHDHPLRLTPRVLHLNTFLMNAAPHAAASKPEVKDRARELGRMVVGRYDLLSLCEVWEQELRFQAPGRSVEIEDGDHAVDLARLPLGAEHFETESSELSRILTAWKDSGRTLPRVRLADREGEWDDFMATGLVFVLEPPYGVVRTKRYRYRRESGLDAYASKSVELIELGVERDGVLQSCGIDWYFTHTDASGQQQQQISELKGFVARSHDPRNVAIVTGDLNIDASRLDEREELYRRLRSFRLEQGGREITLIDQWNEAIHGAGYTALNDAENLRALDSAFVPASDDHTLCEEPGPAILPARKPARIDYCFLELPHEDHRVNVDISRIRRTRFERRPDAPGREPEAPPSGPEGLLDAVGVAGLWRRDSIRLISDHLGLQFSLLITPR